MTTRYVYLDGKPQGTSELEPWQVAEKHPGAIVERVTGLSVYLRTLKPGRKWLYLHVVQGHYGQGWEDLCQSESPWEARQDLKSYRENETQYPHRMIKRRELNPEAGSI